MYKFVVFAVVLGTALAGGKGKCPKAFGKYPLDEEKMVGVWNMIASTHAGIPGGLKCATFNYQLPAENQTTTTIGVSAIKVKDGASEKAEIIVQPIFGKEKGRGVGNGFAVYKKQDGSTSPVMMQSILTTDYDNYAVIMACAQVFNPEINQFGRHIKIHIVSRQNSISQETFNVLKNLISGYDIDPETIKLAESLDC